MTKVKICYKNYIMNTQVFFDADVSIIPGRSTFINKVLSHDTKYIDTNLRLTIVDGIKIYWNTNLNLEGDECVRLLDFDMWIVNDDNYLSYKEGLCKQVNKEEFALEKLLLEKRIEELESQLLQNKVFAIELMHALENSIFIRTYMKDLALSIKENSTI